MDYIYMYGMVISTESFLLKGDFPKPDCGAEILENYNLIGGETGTASAILSNLGCKIVIGGSHLGYKNDKLIRDYFKDKNVDTNELLYEDFEGVIDYVFISKNARTYFGKYEQLYSRKIPFYEPPKEDSIKNCSAAGIDPFFGDLAAEFCVKYNKPFVTIDCTFDSYCNRHCAVNAVSHQYLESVYPDKSFEELYCHYTENSDGLIIFTNGENELLYGRKGEDVKYFKPYQVNAVSTLGAGDSFKAGVIYALFNGMSDYDIVRYGCAVAGVACENFPIPLNLPSLSQVEKLIN